MLTRDRWRVGGDLRRAATRVIPAGLWVGALALAAWEVGSYVSGGEVGIDAHAYWLAGHRTHPYEGAPNTIDAFLYSPVFALLMRPFALLPWPVFAVLWLSLEAAAFLWLLRPLPWRWRGPALLACTAEVLTGNIYGMLTAALVASMRRPGFLAAPLLTKIVPGGVGLAWFAARAEWRRAGETLLVTGALVALSVALTPHLWVEWLRFLVANSGAPGEGGRVIRLVGALLICALAGRRGWVSLLPLAYWLAMPMATVIGTNVTMLAACVRLAGSHRPEAARTSNGTVESRVP